MLCMDVSTTAEVETPIKARERLVLLLLLAAFVLHAIWLSVVAEDAYITFRYARHVAEGLGFAWNPGEAPVEGFTSLAWVLLGAVYHRAGFDLPLASQVTGILAGVLVLLVVYRLARNVMRVGSVTSLLVVACCAAAGPLACWAASGMETAVFTLLVVFAVYRAARFEVSRRVRDAAVAAVSLAAASLTRPEGAGIFVVVTGIVGYRWLRTREPRLLAGLAALIAILVPTVVGLTAWRLATFGYPLPNTFYAKTGGGLHQVRRGISYTAFFTIHYLAPFVPWVLLAWWERSRPDWPRSPFRPERSTGPSVAAGESGSRGTTTIAFVVLTYLAYVVAIGGDYMAMYRFFVPMLPLAFVLLAPVIQSCFDAARSPQRTVLLGVIAALTIGTILVHSTPLEARLFAVAPGTHGTWRGVQVERWHVARFHVLADALEREPHRDSDSVLTYDIGVTGYRLRMRVFDALGITDPVIAHETVKPDAAGFGMAGHEKQDLEYSFSRAPTFFVYTVRLRPEPADWPRLPPRLDAQVRGLYERRSTWLDDQVNGERGYFTYLVRKR
jgi:hypothetical protein